MNIRINTILFLCFCFPALGATAQEYVFPTDSLGRGYIDRPYARYEAEDGWCETNGVFLAPSDNQRDLQAEASHQQAVSLAQAGDYVAWTVAQAGDGLTLRFSLPDNEEGMGNTGSLSVYAGEEQVGSLTLSSYWAWQYCTVTYPSNTPRTDGIIRMRFDEVHVRLSRPVEAGELLRLVRTGTEAFDYTIDFVELEPVPAPCVMTASEAVVFDGEGDIADFIAAHQGATIYIPEGRWETQKRIYLDGADGTRLVGAGMWYTEIYFAAPSDNATTYAHRGIEASRNNLLVEGLYLNTVNNRRYYMEDSRYQVGKAFMGNWGKQSVIRNCWAEHFECGAWIADYSGHVSEDLLIEGCRFRNHYADGVNCSQASTRHIVRQCSFRNNGDDDMASWTTSRRCVGVEFAYCTAENNWRASSLGFFGGTAHRAHHLAIFDGLESGVRVNADFTGLGFGDTDSIYIHDVSVVHCGCPSGTKGVAGDFWGNRQAAVNIGGTANYDVQHIVFANVDIVDSRYDAVMLSAGNGKTLRDIRLRDVHIDGTGRYGIFYYGASGDVMYCHLTISNCATAAESTPSPLLHIDDSCGQEMAINTIKSLPAGDKCYNLLGMQVPLSTTGIVIIPCVGVRINSQL